MSERGMESPRHSNDGFIPEVFQREINQVEIRSFEKEPGRADNRTAFAGGENTFSLEATAFEEPFNCLNSSDIGEICLFHIVDNCAKLHIIC